MIGLTVEDVETLTEWLARGMGSPTISAGLKQDGHLVGGNVILLHLGGKCCCPDGVPMKGARRVAIS